jgi:serine/threonine protein kinase
MQPAMGNGDDQFPELVRDSRLQTTFYNGPDRVYTIHTWSGGHRTRRRDEAWFNQRCLGRGGQATVDLQVQEELDGSGPPQCRAVKSIWVPGNEISSTQALYVRELEAFAKFSQDKVSSRTPLRSTIDQHTQEVSLQYTDFFVKSYGWYDSPEMIHIAMEYCALGDLRTYLSDHTKCPNHRLPEDHAQEIAAQVLEALSLMHMERFAHRDLKPAVRAHPHR